MGGAPIMLSVVGGQPAVMVWVEGAVTMENKMTDNEYAKNIRNLVRQINEIIKESKLHVDMDYYDVCHGHCENVRTFKPIIRRTL